MSPKHARLAVPLLVLMTAFFVAVGPMGGPTFYESFTDLIDSVLHPPR